MATERFKAAGGVGVQEMTAALNVVAKEKKTPDNWAGSSTIALYKGKGQTLEFAKYRGLWLLEHGMKLLEKSPGHQTAKSFKDCGELVWFQARYETG